MKVLVVGSGGRENAICWSISLSKMTKKLFCTPGNAGIAEYAICLNVKEDNFTGILDICKTHSIDLVVVGAEKPLSNGLTDFLRINNVRVFGPSQKASMLESSKTFTKNLCKNYNIPTAHFKTFTDPISAKNYLENRDFPLVIKADGLAAGKGVIIAENLEIAKNSIDQMFSGFFGNAGKRILIEEFLEGEEVSFFVLCDGNNFLPLTSAQDHKRVGEGDTGPNTGGMGAYSPAPILNKSLEEEIIDTIIKPTLGAMKNEGTPFSGVLYAGLMITEGKPKLIEYNVRFGDPECQVILTRLDSDILPALLAACDGELDKISLSWKKEFSLIVIMASNGYPGNYSKGDIISGLANIKNKNTFIFHSGTKKNLNQIETDGGRVLGVACLEKNIDKAQQNVYSEIQKIQWPGAFYRKDIGWRAIKK